jgi:beta-glucosidase
VRFRSTHGIAADEADAARQALLAGIDMEMVSRLFGSHLPRLIEQGLVDRFTNNVVVSAVF